MDKSRVQFMSFAEKSCAPTMKLKRNPDDTDGDGAPDVSFKQQPTHLNNYSSMNLLVDRCRRIPILVRTSALLASRIHM